MSLLGVKDAHRMSPLPKKTDWNIAVIKTV